MSLRRQGRLVFALPFLVGAVALGLEACGDSEPATMPDDGGTSGVDVGTGEEPRESDATTGSDADDHADVGVDAHGDVGADADAGTDADVDPTRPVTCKSLHDGNPDLTDGLYTVDFDGNGTQFSPIRVYCDMTFDGGGWTMIQSFTGTNSPSNLTGPGDAGPGLLVGVPRPGSLGGPPRRTSRRSRS